MSTTPVISKGYCAVSAGQVHYRATQRRDGVPVVFLHQTASSSAMYAGVLAELPDSVWGVAFDTPGFGESFTPARPPTIADYAAALSEALQTLGVNECFLFGHHTGAAIAVQIAYTQPGLARKLILCGPPLLSASQIESLKQGLPPFAIQADGQHLWRVWERLRRRDPDLPLDITHREALLTLTAGASATHTYQAVFDHDIAGQLAALDLPVLVMAGEHDTLRASLEPAYTLLRHGQMRVIPTAGTYICDREPKRVADIVCAFFLAV